MAADHLCYLLEDDRILVAGDLVRGDESGDHLAAPADLDAAGWLASIERLSKLRPPLRGIAPGHGHFIDDAKAALAHQLRGRLSRERRRRPAEADRPRGCSLG